ncbi:MAG: hypothetical protein VZS44_06085 [Bacilli bacterium]|nr:hypothetical protein [Bacilli bacterium]
MEKYKLKKENKYLGQVDISEGKVIAKLLSRRNRIRIFSVILAIDLSFMLLHGIGKKTSRDNDVDYMYENFYLDTDSVNKELVLFKDKYKQLEDRYNSMTDEEKNEYVVFIFNNIIDNSDEFTDEEKNYLKYREVELLKEYGHCYYFESIFDMVSRLRRLKVERNTDLEDGIGGDYDIYKNVISVDKDGDESTLGHEVEHTITINIDKDEVLKNLKIDSDGWLYLFEAMNSSSDLKYYDNYSYNSKMRTHMLFLSKIIGRDNLLKVYLNSDFELLEELLGDDYKELMQLFEKQFELYFSSLGMDYRYCDDIAEKMKDIYEKKNNCSIEEDIFMNELYTASKAYSNTAFISTLFDDKISFTKDTVIDFFDKNSFNTSFFCIYDGDLIIKDGKKDGLDTNNIDNIRIRKLDYFIPDKVIDKMVNSDKPVEYLKIYLEELGVSNSDYWAYNIYNKDYSIFCSSAIYNYDTNNFYSDLKIILEKKYYELKKDDKLNYLYYGFDVFFLDKENVSEDKFREFFNKYLNYEDGIDADYIINSSRRIYK